MGEEVNVSKQNEPARPSELASEDRERKYFNKPAYIFHVLFMPADSLPAVFSQRDISRSKVNCGVGTKLLYFQGAGW